MATGVMKQFLQMSTSIPMVIQLLFLVLVYYDFHLADGQECSVPNTTTLGDVNSKEFTGQVEFCLYGDWGAVCAFDTLNKFNTPASQVVCYELGYSGEGATTAPGANTVSNGIVWLGNVRCLGDEEKLNDCKEVVYRRGVPQPCKDPPASAYVTCPKESQVRLYNYQDNKTRDYHGVVEHWYNGSWHVLCDTGNWTLNDSQVVCQQLGLGEAMKPVYKYEGKIGTLDYLQNNIHCHNNEDMIRKCRVEKHWNTTSTCNVPSTVVNVVCQGPVVQDITITNSTSESVTLSWKLPPNFYDYNADVVRKFRVRFWPESEPSQERHFHRSSYFSDATLEFLTPDTTYEIVIVTMMGDHSGPDSKKLSVKTGKSPIIVGLSCGLALSVIVIAIFGVIIIAILSRYIKRRVQHIPPVPPNEDRPLLDNNGDGNNQPEDLERSGAFYDAINYRLNIQDGNNGGGHQEVI